MAIKRSRDQIRISLRKEWAEEGRSAGTRPGKTLCNGISGATLEDGLGTGFSGDEVTGSDFSSVFSIFALPRIYNTFFATRARFDFHPRTGRIRVAAFLPLFREIRAGAQAVASPMR
jgi:hypothetical protein